MSYKEDLVGNIYGRLTVIAKAERLPGKYVRWICRCESTGYVDGTRLSRIINLKLTAANTSGFCGIYCQKI